MICRCRLTPTPGWVNGEICRDCGGSLISSCCDTAGSRAVIMESTDKRERAAKKESTEADERTVREHKGA
jgi:hypothetical protein